MEDRSISDWILRARSGDAEAIDRLCRHFESRISRFVSRRLDPATRRWAESGDIVQQVVFETISRLGDLPPDAGEVDIARRLHQASKWRILDVWRKHRRDLGESAVGNHVREGPEEDIAMGSVTQRDTRRWLEELVDCLPESYAPVVRCCAIEGLGYAETGRRLGLSAEAVRKRYERARHRLSQKLSDRRDA